MSVCWRGNIYTGVLYCLVFRLATCLGQELEMTTGNADTDCQFTQ